jgi:hypothetical protein
MDASSMTGSTQSVSAKVYGAHSFVTNQSMGVYAEHATMDAQRRLSVEVVIYPGGHHLLEQRQPSLRMDYITPLADWVERWTNPYRAGRPKKQLRQDKRTSLLRRTFDKLAPRVPSSVVRSLCQGRVRRLRRAAGVCG